MLTRTVAETAALLDVLAGYELGDTAWAPEPDVPFADAAAREPGRLRIAVVTRPPLDGAAAGPGPASALSATPAQLLASLGHDVEEVDDVPWAVPGLLQLFTASFGPALTMQMAFASMVSGREVAQDAMEPLSWAHLAAVPEHRLDPGRARRRPAAGLRPRDHHAGRPSGTSC